MYFLDIIIVWLVCVIFLFLVTLCEKNASTEEVAGLTVNINDHVDAEQLHNFER